MVNYICHTVPGRSILPPYVSQRRWRQTTSIMAVDNMTALLDTYILNDQLLYQKCGRIVRFSLKGNDKSNDTWYWTCMCVSIAIYKVRAWLFACVHSSIRFQLTLSNWFQIFGQFGLTKYEELWGKHCYLEVVKFNLVEALCKWLDDAQKDHCNQVNKPLQAT